MRRLQHLRNGRVAQKSRETYASGICQLLVWLWQNKKHLLADAFLAEASPQGVCPTVAVLKKRLPGLEEAGLNSWPEPLKWEEFTADHFMEWMLARKDAGKLSKSQLGTKRAALNCFFCDYGKEAIYKGTLTAGLSSMSKGLNRELAAQVTAGNGEVREGKMPLSFKAYRAIGLGFLKHSVADNHHCDGPFAHLYFVLMWNLMCRSSNVTNILLQHWEWKEDAAVVYFSQQKTDQTGARAKDPRHIYANPLMPEICPLLSLGIYWMCFEAKGDVKDRLFGGTKQKERYTKALKRMVQTDEIKHNLVRLGLHAADVGSHSCRKGASSYCSSGSTACPSGVAISLRAGWSLPGVEGTYKRYESAGDQYIGRVCAGLPVNSEEFMRLAPAFAYVGPNGEELPGQEVCCLISLPERLRALAEHAVASVLYHLDWLKETLPQRHRLWSNPLLMHGAEVLKARVWCSCAESAKAVKEGRSATGLPPYASLMASMASLRREVSSLPNQVEHVIRTLLEADVIQGGQVTPQNLSSTIADCLRKSGLDAFLQQVRDGELRQVMQGEGGRQPGGAAEAGALHTRASGKVAILPESFFIPSMTTPHAWVTWMCGSDDTGNVPWRKFSSHDIPGGVKRAWNSFSFIMGEIESFVKQAEELWKDDPTIEEAKKMYEGVRSQVEVEGQRHKRRNKQLAWRTVCNNYKKEQTRKRRALTQAVEVDPNQSVEEDGSMEAMDVESGVVEV
ncbi:unnamed protein product [Chrysoparadoxa australica]